jgi:hypothetical protein
MIHSILFRPNEFGIAFFIYNVILFRTTIVHNLHLFGMVFISVELRLINIECGCFKTMNGSVRIVTVLIQC